MKKFATFLQEAGRGRPKKNSTDSDEMEGKRDVVIIADITTEDGKKKKEVKKLGTVSVEEVKKEKKAFEQALFKKYGYDSEIDIQAKVGGYSDSEKAEDHMERDPDAEHSIAAKKKN